MNQIKYCKYFVLKPLNYFSVKNHQNPKLLFLKHFSTHLVATSIQPYHI